MIVERHVPSSIFVSYSRVDRAFVKSLTRSLIDAGVNVTYDEMENLRLGDRLSRRLKEAIDGYDYLAVVLSPTSVSSEWVNRELKWAIDAEEASGRDKILPLIAHPCEVPDFLIDRKRADMSNSGLRRVGLIDLISRLGGDAFTATAELYPLLGSLRLEAVGDGVSHSTIEAIAITSTPASVLEPFLSKLIEVASPNGLLALAVIGMRLADRIDACHSIVEAAIASPGFPAYGLASVSSASTTLRSPEAVMWWHDLFVDQFHDDVYYHTLLQHHAAILLAERYDDVAAYLLVPDRGPARYNFDSLLVVIKNAKEPGPFVERWRGWILNGRFEGETNDDEGPQILYSGLNEVLAARPDVVASIQSEALKRTKYLVKLDDPVKVRHGLDHVAAMLDREVPFPRDVQITLLDGVHYEDGGALFRILGEVEPAFKALEKLQNGSGTREEFEAAHRKASSALKNADPQLGRRE